MLWKRPNPTRCIASVSVWQGPWRRPSLADLHWQHDCSLEGTCIIPRERYVSSLCPQISENWKRIWRIYSYWIRNIHTGSEFICCHWLPQGFVRTRTRLFIPDPILFIPDLKYSYRVQIYLLSLTAPRICSYRDSFIHTGSHFIHTRFKFINLLLIIPETSHFKVELTIYLEIICTRYENTEEDPSNWLTSQK